MHLFLCNVSLYSHAKDREANAAKVVYSTDGQESSIIHYLISSHWILIGMIQVMYYAHSQDAHHQE